LCRKMAQALLIKCWSRRVFLLPGIGCGRAPVDSEPGLILNPIWDRIFIHAHTGRLLDAIGFHAKAGKVRKMEWYAVQFCVIPAQDVSFFGAMQLIILAAIWVFGFRFPKPTKEN